MSKKIDLLEKIHRKKEGILMVSLMRVSYFSIMSLNVLIYISGAIDFEMLSFLMSLSLPALFIYLLEEHKMKKEFFCFSTKKRLEVFDQINFNFISTLDNEELSECYREVQKYKKKPINKTMNIAITEEIQRRINDNLDLNESSDITEVLEKTKINEKIINIYNE